MTLEELKKVPFHMVCLLALAHEHSCTYASEDGRLGFCDHTPVIGDPEFREFGKPRRHWRIDNKVYKTKAAFLKALEQFNPTTK